MPPVSDSSIKFNEARFNTVPFNAWTYPTAPKNLASIIRGSVHYPFRKVEIKRRNKSDGQYESSWLDITQFVEQFSSMESSVDDIQVNKFVHSGVNLTVKNDYGEFNPEFEGKSLFHGYLTRTRTLVRITAGYTDGSGNQFPSTNSDCVQGVFIMSGDIDLIPRRNVTGLECKSLISIFEDVGANQIDGINPSITASGIVELIRDATDGSGNLLFRTFITSTSWTIQTTTAIITGFDTTTALESFSVWELLNKLAEAEGFVVHITRHGGFVFADRQPNSSESSFSLYGSGYRDPNIVSLESFKPAIDKLYTHVRFKYLPDDTVTSYIDLGAGTEIDPDDNEWIYGRRTYEYENTLFTSTQTAENSAIAVMNAFGNLKNELELKALFLPNIELLDRVSIYHREGSVSSIYLWDTKDWAADTTTSDGPNVLLWASETSAAIDLNGNNFIVIAKKTNLDDFTTELKLREVN